MSPLGTNIPPRRHDHFAQYTRPQHELLVRLTFPRRSFRELHREEIPGPVV